MTEEFESGVKEMSNLGDAIFELGEQRGEQNILMLIQKLLTGGRNEDIQKITDDKEYRNRLLKEFNLI